MTSNKEDYLKAIYQSGGLEEFIPNKIIAEKLSIAPASVSEMLTKLNQEGLIESKAYRGSKLTENGLAACIEIVRSHRLWEVFLMRHLGYTWREAHEDAELLEHIAPHRMIDRLDTFLNYPRYCPHGSVIPQNGDVPKQSAKLQALNELVEGDSTTVVRISEEPRLLDYLERSGLELNKEIQVLSAGEYEGPITFLQDANKITISYKAAAQIFVEYKK